MSESLQKVRVVSVFPCFFSCPGQPLFDHGLPVSFYVILLSDVIGDLPPCLCRFVDTSRLAYSGCIWELFPIVAHHMLESVSVCNVRKLPLLMDSTDMDVTYSPVPKPLYQVDAPICGYIQRAIMQLGYWRSIPALGRRCRLRTDAGWRCGQLWHSVPCNRTFGCS